MNIRFLPGMLLILASFLGACSSVARPREEIKLDPSAVITAQPDVPVTPPQQDTVVQTSGITITSTVVPPKSELVLADNSKVTTSKDDAGNKVETRVFGKNSAISQIIVRTSPDGQKRVELYYDNTSSKPAAGDAAGLVLTESANELESRFGLRPAVETTSKVTTAAPAESAGPMPLVEKSSPNAKSESPAVKPKSIVTVPQLPPVVRANR